MLPGGHSPRQSPPQMGCRKPEAQARESVTSPAWNDSGCLLPPPSQLVRKEDTVKVTSEFTRSSIEFLKKEAKKANVPYEHMLRVLVDEYVELTEGGFGDEGQGHQPVFRAPVLAPPDARRSFLDHS